MTEATAIILDRSRSEASRKISRLLDFFGVTSQVKSVGELFGNPSKSSVIRQRVLGTVQDFLDLASVLASQPEKVQSWANSVTSAFCCTRKEESDQLAKLAQKLDTGSKMVQQSSGQSGQIWKVSETLKDFAGPFAGLKVPSVSDSNTAVWLCQGKFGDTIIGNETGAAFLRIDFHGVPLFLSTSEVIDLDAPLPARSFDVRPHFLSAVPAVLYVKSAFAESCWQHPEIGACLVIDDPLLHPRYGFLDYERMLGLMERLNFSTNIAFIPWNWRRSSQRTVQLFQENPGRFSLSVHGCDHTRAEYGIRSRDRLAWKSRQSIERMGRHRDNTGLPYDPVMVFPQGVFSEASMAVLKAGDFIGTVNSEVISTDPQPRTITIADFWDVAVMNYSDFPIFTRRYPWAGVENFAFDILLGKPCLINIHHNDCHDDYRCVVECIGQLNGLNARLRWTNLGEVVRRSYRQRPSSPGVMDVEIYGNETRLENPGTEKKRFRIRKRESAPDTIREIRVAGEPVDWTRPGNNVGFETTLEANESKTVLITYREISVAGVKDEGMYYQTKVMLRRYLCEIRDNLLMRRSFSE